MRQEPHASAAQRRMMMKKTLVCMSALALASTLSACGREEAPGHEIVSENTLDMMANANNRGEPMTMAPAAAPEAKPAAPAAKSAPTATEPSNPAPAKPAPEAKPKAADPEPAADPHAGHDMNNMSH